MSTTFCCVDTLAVVMSTTEALELVSSWCAQYSANENDVLDKADPNWSSYWLEELEESDYIYPLDEDNCCGYETCQIGELDGCGSAVNDMVPFGRTLWYIPCKQTENPFRAAYGSVDDVLDEYQNDEAYITCNQSKQWLRDHLVYITCVRFF